MKLAHTTKGEAQARADEMHQWLIANKRLYAESVASGHTLRWAIPRQEVDRDGNVIDANWHVPVDERVIGALKPEERAKIPEIKAMDDRAREMEAAQAEAAQADLAEPVKP